MTSVSNFLYPLASQLARPNEESSAIYPDSEIPYRRLRVPSRPAKIANILPGPALRSGDGGSFIKRSGSQSLSRSNSVRLSSQAAANSLKRVFSRRRRRAAEILFGQELDQLDESQMARLDSELNRARIEMGLDPIFDSTYKAPTPPKSSSSTLRSKRSKSLSSSLSRSLSLRSSRERRAANVQQDLKPAPAVLRDHKVPRSADTFSEKTEFSSDSASTTSLRHYRRFGSKRLVRAYEYDEQTGIKRLIHACKRVFTRLPKNSGNYLEAAYSKSMSIDPQQESVEPVTIPEPCYLRPGKAFRHLRSSSSAATSIRNQESAQQHYFYDVKTPESPLSKYLKYQSSSLAASSVYSHE